MFDVNLSRYYQYLKSKRGIYFQLRSAMPTLLKLYIPTLALLASFVLAKFLWNVRTSDLTRDPAQITGSHPLYGLLSNLGILVWCSTAAICIYSSAILRKSNKNRSYASFLLVSGIITSILMIDDFFLFHDYILPVYIHVHEYFVYVAYALLMLSWFYFFRRTMLETDWALLFLSLVFFGLSIIFDLFNGKLLGGWIFEDGCKFLGILTWMYYYTHISFQRLNLELKFVGETQREAEVIKERDTIAFPTLSQKDAVTVFKSE